MSQCRLTPAAQRDLSSIWDFTEERWDARQAERYIREIQGAIERIAVDPRRGRARDEIRAGYRSYAIASHAVFYVPRADSVDVIRILHQRMDPCQYLHRQGPRSASVAAGPLAEAGARATAHAANPALRSALAMTWRGFDVGLGIRELSDGVTRRDQ